MVEKDSLIKLFDESIKFLRKGWCKKALSRDENYQHVGTYSPKASQWCLYGAIWRATNELGYSNPEFAKAIELLKKELSNRNVDRTYIALGQWNDNQESVESVIELVEKVKQDVSSTYEG